MNRFRKIMLTAGIVILAAAAFASVSCTKAEEEMTVLRWGLIPADDAAEMLRNYQPLAEYLEGVLGITVELQVTMDYTAAIEAMRNKHIDVAWYGPFSYIMAAREAGAEALVNGVRRDTGKASYRSVIVTRKDSGIKTVDDLDGRSFAFVDPASTSGHLIPRKMLLDNGIDPDNDFSTMYYAGTHNSAVMAVLNGTVDAAATSDTTYFRMLKEGEIDDENIVIILESPDIPGSPIAIRGDLPEDFKESIRQAMLDMDQQALYQVEGWGDIEKYVAVTDADYDIIREVSAVLDLD